MTEPRQVRGPGSRPLRRSPLTRSSSQRPGGGDLGGASGATAPVEARQRPGRPGWRAWSLLPRLGQELRLALRVMVLLVLTSVLSLLVGMSTATASAPVGPHEATWSTTLDSTVTLDLGPLGSASMRSPAAPVGLEVVLGEIPSEATQVDVVDASVLGESLSSDAAAYVALVAHPDLTIQRGLHALLHDGLRRAGVIEGVVLCLVVAVRLGTVGRLRRVLRSGPVLRLPLAAATAAFLAATVVMLAPAVQPAPSRGTTLAALEDTPLAEARFSGRVADVVAAYGPRVTGFLESNESFYADADANLRAAWAASQEVGGTVDVTAVDATVDRQEVAARAASVADGAEGGLGGGSTDASAKPSAAPTSPSSVPPTSAGATLEPTPTTGAQAVAQRGAVTAVLSTDLHCNLDVIAFTGVLDEVAGADVHMDDGDLTMTGSDPEQLCVDALSAAVPGSVAKVATIGNHDSSSTAARLRSQGWTVTDGTVKNVGGLRVLGQEDPDRTTATGTTSRSGKTAQQVGTELAATSCTGGGSDVVLIHQPDTFGPLVSEGCAPLLLAGHFHTERGMTTSQGARGEVSALVSGAGKGGTSLGAVTEDAYLHVLSFSDDGRLVAWRSVVLSPDASVTVGAWQPVPSVHTDQQAGTTATPTGSAGASEAPSGASSEEGLSSTDGASGVSSTEGAGDAATRPPG